MRFFLFSCLSAAVAVPVAFVAAAGCSSDAYIPLPVYEAGATIGASFDATAPDGTTGVDGSPLPDGATCDPAKTPHDAPCVIADAYGVFVAPTGNDTAAGTMSAPFKTITHAIAAAKQASKRVYACAATYPEQVVLAAATDGVSLYGGLACPTVSPVTDAGATDAALDGAGPLADGGGDASSDAATDAGAAAPWSYTGGKAIVAPAAAGYALKIDTLASAVTIEDFELDALPAASAGASSVAALVNAAQKATLHRVKILAGNGVPGSMGTAITGTIATTSSGMAATSDVGGATVSCSCANAGATTGGSGGNADTTAPGSGAAGTPALGGGAGGTGSIVMCTDGSAGAMAPAGVGGAGATSPATVSAAGWTGTAGANGGAGVPGQGGGGGGGGLKAAAHGGGGSGACGGCGGAGGPGGMSGGSSVALLSVASTLTLDACTVVSANGGDGGGGASGQAGGSGGAGAAGDVKGCNGAAGGTGGSGGGGGGGAGGDSIAVAYTGTAPMQINATATTTGNAGKGGVGGAGQGQNGAAGVAASSMGF